MSTAYSSIARPVGEIVESRDELVKEYFYASYSYDEIISILFLHHGVKLGLRKLKRVLRRLGLRRRDQTHDAEIVEAIQSEIQGTGSSLGYRSMSRRLLTRHGLSVSRTLVSQLQRLIDPVGVSSRQHHQLRRRTYRNKGPNFLIHVDGYDKLKPYGFCVHGAICGCAAGLLLSHTAGECIQVPEIPVRHLPDSAVTINYLETFIKSGEQLRRAGVGSVVRIEITKDVPIPHQLDKVWASPTKYNQVAAAGSLTGINV